MIKNTFLIFLFILKTTTFFGQTVSNETELNSAIQNAIPGTTITLSNGTWKDIFINLDGFNGTSTNPITIEAETSGFVYMTGNSRIYMEGSYITVTGLVFKDAENLVASSTEIEPVIELKECDNCKVINNKIDSYNGTEAQKTLKFKWILTDGQYNEIAYNSFIGKYGIGSIINDNRNSSDADYLKIHHNYFADRTPINELNDDNDQDAIRIGNSSTSLSDSFTEVYDNYFYNFFGEVEVISNKSGNNKYYNNTFRDYAGSLTLRHGDNCEVYSNFFFAESNAFSAGVRVIGEGHKIYNNYIEATNYLKPSGSGSGATGGINVSNGKPDSALNEYYQVKDAFIINNTFVNCDYALRIGTTVKEELTLAPENLTIANNIMLNSSINALEEQTAPIGTSIYQGNITQNGNWDIDNNINDNITVTSDLLTVGTDFYKLTNTSSAIAAGTGTFSFLTSDILEGNRGATFDAGAEEFEGGGIRLPYKNEDVGVTIGFGADIFYQPELSTSENSFDFNLEANQGSFTIIADVNWEINTDADWITLNTNAGSNNSDIDFFITENNTDIDRMGIITISDTDGNNISTQININQSFEAFNPINAQEISTDNVTAVGTQVDESGAIENGAENTTDNNTSTRWSAESSDGSAYLTFDLGCIHTLTDVSIFFHKSSIRTTKISIATSTDGNSYTNSYTEISSTLLTTEDYEDFDMNLTEARYIRIYGFGNSDGSAWNSIEEVKFYGDSACTSGDGLSNSTFSLSEKGISVYPNPVNDILKINSLNHKINTIEIYNVVGNKVFSLNTSDSIYEEIDTTNLSSGVYFIIIDKIGSSKIIIK